MSKYNYFFIVMLFVITGSRAQVVSAQDYFKQVAELIEQKDYFTARDVYIRNKKDIPLVTDSYLSNAFNQLNRSNQKIDTLFQQYKNQLPDSIQLKLLLIQQNNSIKLYEYKKAEQALELVLKQYKELLSLQQEEEYKNDYVIWKTLGDQPKQEIYREHTHTFKIHRDKAGLANLKVNQGKDSVNFVFDTGANISTVAKTIADRFNMKIFDSEIDVNAITGKKVKARLAICPEFQLGTISIKNAVFLVFKDEDLAFPPEYYINGIIGFPVIDALKEIQIIRNDELIIPEIQTSHPVQNIALDLLTPILQIGTEYYTFDTGAKSTMLYEKYFTRYKREIQEQYKQTEVKYGGVGGIITQKAYIISFFPEINNRKIELKNVYLLNEEEKKKKHTVYGNIGHDFINQFDKMTLNFNSMFIKFE